LQKSGRDGRCSWNNTAFWCFQTFHMHRSMNVAALSGGTAEDLQARTDGGRRAQRGVGRQSCPRSAVQGGSEGRCGSSSREERGTPGRWPPPQLESSYAGEPP
jgi:hypothetical protein